MKIPNENRKTVPCSSDTTEAGVFKARPKKKEPTHAVGNLRGCSVLHLRFDSLAFVKRMQCGYQLRSGSETKSATTSGKLRHSPCLARQQCHSILLNVPPNVVGSENETLVLRFHEF